MKNKCVVLFVLGTCIMGCSPGATAQQTEPQFSVLEEISINTGMVAEFEAASKARTARMVAGNVTFRRRVAVSEGGVYRFRTLLEGDFASVVRWREQIDAMPPSSQPVSAAGIIESIDTSVFQSRPDLSYIPDERRLEGSEVGFLREIRLYVKFGAQAEVAALLLQISELNELHNISGRRLVSSQFIGPGTPVFSLLLLARDAVDYYTQSASDAEALGEDFQDLVNQIRGLCRRIESVNYTTLPDLGYEPSN